MFCKNPGILASLLVLLLTLHSRAQFYDNGQDPTAIKWHQIDTYNYKLVFPSDYDSVGLQLANTYSDLAGFEGKTLEHKPHKIPILLHTQTAQSNGFVTWAPKRSELFSIPYQQLEPGDWLSHLAIHEYRHVIQIDKLDDGFTHFLTFLMGEQAIGGVLGLHVPLWFLEGDAVVTETSLTKSGRGRLPEFEMGLRTQVLEKRYYSYDKAVFGSFRDYVPNHYELGYQLVAYNRIKFIPDIWAAAMQNVANKPFQISAFSKALKKTTGLNKEQLYNFTLCEMAEKWRNQKEMTSYTAFKKLKTANVKYYTNYNYPIYIDTNLVLAEKKSQDDVYQFVAINHDGEEHIIYTPGVRYHHSLSYAKGKIIWDELDFDPRWNYREYSNLYYFDLNAKKTVKITSKSRLFAPAINHGGNKIAAVQVDDMGNYNIVIIEIETGKIIKSIHPVNNEYPITPEWNPEDSKLAVIFNQPEGKSLVEIDVESGIQTILLKPNFIEIKQPKYFGKYILYNASYSGISNIYAIKRENGRIYQVVSAKYGATDHFVDQKKKKLIYSNYTADGYRIVEVDLDDNNWKPLSEVKNHSVKLYDKLAKDEEHLFYFDSLPKASYAIRPYLKRQNLFNFHSWSFYAMNLSNYEISPGISIMSQNLLSTAFTSVGYSMNLDELSGKFYFDFIYKGFYPELGARYENGNRAYYTDDTVRNQWYQQSYRLFASLPLFFKSGKKIFRINIKTSVEQNFNSRYENLPLAISKQNAAFENSIEFSQYELSSQMDIFPRWYKSISIDYKQYYESYLKGSIFALQTYFTFPGIMHNDGFLLYVGWQKKYSDIIEDYIKNPVGYTGLQHKKMGIAEAKWAFPIAYPDLRLKSLAYCKRIKASIFYDFSQAGKTTVMNNYSTAGIDLIGNFNFLRFIFPFELGYRFAYKIEPGNWYQMILFSSSIGSL